MALNYIWVGFFLIAFIIGLLKLIFLQDYEVFPKMMEATFEMAKTGFTLSIGLTGVMTLWLGLIAAAIAQAPESSYNEGKPS